jgi:hypothetical protein
LALDEVHDVIDQHGIHCATLFVATDFFEASDAAVERAVQLAVMHGAVLCLLHAAEQLQALRRPIDSCQIGRRRRRGLRAIVFPIPPFLTVSPLKCIPCALRNPIEEVNS